MIETPSIVETTAGHAAVIRLAVPWEQLSTAIGPAIHEVFDAAMRQGLGPAGPVFAHYHSVDPVFELDVGVPVTAPVAPAGRVVASGLPVEKVVRTTYTGPYEGLRGAWGEFGDWLRTSGHVLASDFWERYVLGPESGLDPSQFRTELDKPLGTSAAEGRNA